MGVWRVLSVVTSRAARDPQTERNHHKTETRAAATTARPQTRKQTNPHPPTAKHPHPQPHTCVSAISASAALTMACPSRSSASFSALSAASSDSGSLVSTALPQSIASYRCWCVLVGGGGW